MIDENKELLEVLKEIKEELRLIAQIISYATGQGKIK